MKQDSSKTAETPNHIVEPTAKVAPKKEGRLHRFEEGIENGLSDFGQALGEAIGNAKFGQ